MEVSTWTQSWATQMPPLLFNVLRSYEMVHIRQTTQRLTKRASRPSGIVPLQAQKQSLQTETMKV